MVGVPHLAPDVTVSGRWMPCSDRALPSRTIVAHACSLHAECGENADCMLRLHPEHARSMFVLPRHEVWMLLSTLCA